MPAFTPTPSCEPCEQCSGRGGYLTAGIAWTRCPGPCAGTGRVVLTSAFSPSEAHELADELRELAAADRECAVATQLDVSVIDSLVLAAQALDDLAAVRSQLVLARKRAEHAETAAALNGATIAEQAEEIRRLRGELARNERRQLKAIGGGK